MALRTRRRKLRRNVVRVRRRVEVRGVAARTGVRRGGVVATNVAHGALVRNQRVRTVQRVECIVVKRRRCPRRFRMALRTRRRKLRRSVVRVRRRVEVRGVAARAGIRRGGIVATNVAHGALVRNQCVRTVQRVECIVVKRRGYPRLFRMALRTRRRKLRRSVVRIRRRIEVRGVAARAGVRRGGIVATNVAHGALVRNQRVRTVQWIIIIMDCKGCRRPTRFGSVTSCAICRNT